MNQRACHCTIRKHDDGGVKRTTDAETYEISAGECRETRCGGGYIFKWDKRSAGKVRKSFGICIKEKIF